MFVYTDGKYNEEDNCSVLILKLILILTLKEIVHDVYDCSCCL